ncbi:MAG: glycosyltransferase family A protein [Pirellulaceae bacterium]|nr:glycosyltransferase family A protein [Pirellulaceae bacterium]
MADLVVTLTSIPTRFDKIAPTLEDLLNQTADIAEIRLYISRKYRRFPDAKFDPPKVPKGIKVCMVDEDFGPATKILPAVKDFQGQNVELLFCDDDQPYDSNWAQRFLDERKRKPNCCIVERGYDLEYRPKGHRYYIERDAHPRAERRIKGLKYRLRRTMSLFTSKPTPYTASGYVDILEGFGGVMVRPDFFPPEVFDIPDILWTVDDPWLSGHLTRNNVPIWLHSNEQQWRRPYGAHFSDRLGAFVYKQHGRLAADSASIDYFRSTYDIWRDKKLPQQESDANHSSPSAKPESNQWQWAVEQR